jgi:hypothetical protein
VLCLQSSSDVPVQYIPVMNAIFAAQAAGVVVDGLVVGAEPSPFLQQAGACRAGVVPRAGGVHTHDSAAGLGRGPPACSHGLPAGSCLVPSVPGWRPPAARPLARPAAAQRTSRAGPACRPRRPPGCWSP